MDEDSDFDEETVGSKNLARGAAPTLLTTDGAGAGSGAAKKKMKKDNASGESPDGGALPGLGGVDDDGAEEARERAERMASQRERQLRE